MDGKDTKQFPSFYQNLIDFVRDHPEPLNIVHRLKRLAEVAIQAEVEYFGPETRTIGHHAYDTLIENIFTLVIRAISREALLTQTIEALWDQKSSKSTQCFFVLETTPGRTPETKNDIKAVTQKGLNEHLWNNSAFEVSHWFDQ
jgi:hypothetical protein